MGRPHWSERWAFLAGGGLLLAVGLASVFWKQNPWGLVFLVVGAATLLELRSGETVAARVRHTDVPGTRRWFTSHGSCSVSEPLDDLIALGLLEGPSHD